MNPDERQQPRQTPLQQMGGAPGILYAGLPTLVFVVADAVAGLNTAVAFAVGAGAGITLLRLLRREPLQPALSGLLGVAIAAVVAYLTGDAKNYFLIGIWLSFAMAVVFFVSVLMRRPLVGLIWGVLSGGGQQWRADRPSLIGYDMATLAVVAVFASRFVVQHWLYGEDSTGWLAFARIAMGYPLTAAALVVVVWAVRRADRRRKEQSQPQPCQA